MEKKEADTLVRCVRENATCVVCQGAYRKPITMPCGHSFCRMCVGKLIFVHLKACQEASDQNKMSETRSGKCPTCREALPTIAPAYRVNVALESIARAYEKHTNVNEEYNEKEEAEEYTKLLKEIASLQQKLRWKNTTYVFHHSIEKKNSESFNTLEQQVRKETCHDFSSRFCRTVSR